MVRKAAARQASGQSARSAGISRPVHACVEPSGRADGEDTYAVTPIRPPAARNAARIAADVDSDEEEELRMHAMQTQQREVRDREQARRRAFEMPANIDGDPMYGPDAEDELDV